MTGDGRPDLVSGALDGPVMIFEAKEGGGFAPRRPLLQVDGAPLILGTAISIALADWDGDGRTDMVAGQIDGPVVFLKGVEGGKFAKKTPLFTTNDGPITAVDGGPELTDWDGDGDLDLLLGEFEGAVRLYENTGPGSPPMLTREPDLVPRVSPDELDALVSADMISTRGRPALRTKPHAFDWDGDGKPDLLVGDWMLLEPSLSALPEKDRKRIVELEKLLAGLNKELNKTEEAAAAALRKQMDIPPKGDIPPEKFEEFYNRLEAVMNADKAYQAKAERVNLLFEEQFKLKGLPEYAGYVWLYHRKK